MMSSCLNESIPTSEPGSLIMLTIHSTNQTGSSVQTVEASTINSAGMLIPSHVNMHASSVRIVATGSEAGNLLLLLQMANSLAYDNIPVDDEWCSAELGRLLVAFRGGVRQSDLQARRPAQDRAPSMWNYRHAELFDCG